MSKLRILIWCPHISVGGGERLLKQLFPAIAADPRVGLVRIAVPAGTLTEHDFNLGGALPVEVARLNPARLRNLPRWLAAPGRVYGIRGSGKLKQLLAARVTARSRRWFRRAARALSRDCDVIYVFWPHHFPFIGGDKPIVCTFHDATLFDFPEIIGKDSTQREFELSRVWLRRSTQVVAPSQATKSSLIRIFGPGLASAEVINHAILPDVAESAARSSAFVQQLPPRYVIWPSGMSSHKNHHNLLLAWGRFSRKSEYPLVLIGHSTDALITGEYPDYWVFNYLEGVIKRKQLRPGVDLFALGHVPEEDLMPLVAHAAALIMPSLSEGGGSYPVEEALSAGVPVLSSDIPVMREHLASRSAKVAWFDGESVSSIVEALELFFSNYEEYKQSAVAAMRDPRPTWQEIASRYVDVFSEVARKAGKSGQVGQVGQVGGE